MLIHIIPQIYIPGPIPVRVVRVDIPELGWSWEAPSLQCGRPYPNKGYWVGYHNSKARATIGLLLETPGPLARYTVETEWELTLGTSWIATHRVEHVVLDQEHEAVSDRTLLWYGQTGPQGQTWKPRWPSVYHDYAPVMIEPRMDVFADSLTRAGEIRDTLDPEGRILRRTERFQVPTIERERLFDTNSIGDRGDRMPVLIDHAG